MILSIRRACRTLALLCVFCCLTLVLYLALQWVSDWISPVDHYRIPEGNAIKVFIDELPAKEEPSPLSERLRFFYWYGE
ncbi:DUF4227 family protein [Paenibacillus sp. FSL K6-1230]|uniref:DUF4227 family protein n=1 Tax=Paenibacillus sp. FSL K6-1230 TaxID=2921603 RepID=UPI00039E1177